MNILALNPVKSVAMVFDSFGHTYKNYKFDFSTFDVAQSCDIIWKNQVYIFGGQRQKRQILKVDKCQLKNTGKQLPMDTSYPACVNAEDEIWICFVLNDTNDSKVNGSLFSSLNKLVLK